MHKRLVVSLVALTLGFALSGCVSTEVWVLKGDEMVPLRKGEAFTAPYDGCYYSLDAEKRVMDAKRIDTNLK